MAEVARTPHRDGRPGAGGAVVRTNRVPTGRFVDRYADDPTPPRFGGFMRDMVVRAWLPAAAWFVVLVGVGWLIEHPLHDLPAEERIEVWLYHHRTPRLDWLTHYGTLIGSTTYAIAACLVLCAVLMVATRRWWYAVVPALSLAMEATFFSLATLVTGRHRPAVPHLDPAPPTSSYPSGHTSAVVAVYGTAALAAHRIRNVAVRRLVQLLCCLVPVFVGVDRLYRGMHHLTDVVMGAANGLVCCLLAWGYLRRRPGTTTTVGARTAHEVGVGAPPPATLEAAETMPAQEGRG